MSEEKKSEGKKPEPSKVPVIADERGVLLPRSLEEFWRLGTMMHASRMLPQQYDTVEKVVVGIQYAAQLGFGSKFLLAMRQIAVINGTPSIFGDLPLSLVMSSGLLEEIEEYLVDAEGQRISIENKNISKPVFAAVCRVKRKGFAADTKMFTIEDAKTAKVWGTKVWAVYPKRMLQMRTRSIALKDWFADVLNGMAIGEYEYNTVIEETNQTVTQEGKPVSRADQLAAMFGKKEVRDVEVEVSDVQSVEPSVVVSDGPSAGGSPGGENQVPLPARAFEEEGRDFGGVEDPGVVPEPGSFDSFNAANVKSLSTTTVGSDPSVVK